MKSINYTSNGIWIYKYGGLDTIIDFSKNCGAEIPSWILNRLKLYRSDAESLKEFGEDVVSEMCLKLKAGGVKNFHFYSMNRVEPVLSIAKRIL